MTLKNITPSPFITCFLEDNSKVHFDTQSIKEILDRLTRRLGKTKETLAEERRPWPLLRRIILLTLVLSMAMPGIVFVQSLVSYPYPGTGAEG